MRQGEDTHWKKRTAQGKTPIRKNSKRGDHIYKQIRVLNRHNQILEPTYFKRARQMVKKKRAEWISEDTICLTEPLQEDLILDTNLINTAKDLQTQDIQHDESLEDKALLDLAKRRLAVKKDLKKQGLDLFLLAVSSLIFIYLDWTGERLLWAFLFCFGYTIRLLYRIFVFNRPAFKDGILEYIQRRKEQNLELEYNRLKKLSTEHIEYISSELNS